MDLDGTLDQALGRVDHLAAVARSGSLHFSVGEDTNPAETDLMALLRDPAEAEKQIRWEEIRAEFDSFLVRLDEDILNFAVLHTGPKEAPLVSTRVGWSGDARTVIAASSPRSLLSEHSRNLHRALRTKSIRLKMLAATASVAARISALSTTPLGAMLILPVAYQYIRTMAAHWQSQLELEESWLVPN
ncbi:MAG TPA: hypothetical protein PKY30_15120 [Myxococcota bacterium]|nr:hypothetical protein [Myxococcota bacterium]